ncbi:MAG: hypothetical protein H7263_00925 [Candidatus Sericytochromatia bacterium]|nr:hypothetical protein [Candidatus Sericytochromatia bacterium]
MKLVSKLSLIAVTLFASVSLAGAGGVYDYETKNYENLEDSALNSKLVDLKQKISEQKAGPQEASDMFKKVFPTILEGSAKVNKLWFAEDSTSIVISDSPIPIRILFKGQFLMDNKILEDKIGKTIKFKISDVSIVEEPILETLRIPFTSSPYWIHAVFSSYGTGNATDMVDNLKPGTIPY